jgi:hypothetical protein
MLEKRKRKRKCSFHLKGKCKKIVVPDDFEKELGS